MKVWERWIACLLAGSMAFTAAAIPVNAATTLTISPLATYEINGGKFEGWGTSLCWWANRVGYSDSLAQKTADAFYGEDGLRLNIARFNIGGGDDPSHTHITRTDSNMPGYTTWNGSTASYNWDADANQRNVLLRSIEACGDDMIVEMFSNSPPYYMTNSGCTSGNTDGGKNNLRDDCYDDFAEYLAEVCYHYEHDWGVEIQSVEAMNEPYTNYWYAGSPKQEGCHFDIGNSESTMLLELQKSMEKRGMGDVLIAGTDETAIDTQIDAYNKLSADAKKAVDRIDTHTYGGSKRTQLRDLAIAENKNLWMSEVDGGATAGTNAGEMGAALWLAERITTDMNGLNPSAWILWQVIDNHISSVGMNGNKDKGMVNTQGGYWGCAVADHDNDTIIRTKKYYAFGQYTRYIRPGMTMLSTSGNTLAAFDEETGQLVIVACNTSGSAAQMHYDLSGFGKLGASATPIRTSNTESWTELAAAPLSGDALDVTLAPQSVTTFLIDGCESSVHLDDPLTLTDTQLSGSSSWKDDESHDYRKAFDGDMKTYFDGVGAGWIQADLGDVYDLKAIGYCPREGYEYRMTDGIFSFSEDGEHWQTAYTVAGKPGFSMHYITKFSCGGKARYVRFAVPEGAPKNEYNTDDVYCCNIAELRFYGELHPTAHLDKLTPETLTGSDAWKGQEAYDFRKAFDGDLTTYFDGVTAGWVQADMGGLYTLEAIGYCPRKGYEARMTDGYFEVSTDGKNWTTVHTVTGLPNYAMSYVTLEEPQTFRYLRYAVPEGTPNNPYNTDTTYCCNIAEIELYGSPAGAITGDVNGDSMCSVSDAVVLQKWLLAVPDVTITEAADMDGNGIVNIVDLALLKRQIL